MCEKELSQDEDYENYLPGGGEHLCWNYPLHLCGEDTVEERLIAVLIERDKLKGI